MLSSEEAIVCAGRKVLMVLDYNILLILGNPQRILDQQISLYPILLLNNIIIVVINYKNNLMKKWNLATSIASFENKKSLVNFFHGAMTKSRINLFQDDKWYLHDSMRPVGAPQHGGNCKCYRCQRKLTAI